MEDEFDIDQLDKSLKEVGSSWKELVRKNREAMNYDIEFEIIPEKELE